MNERKKIIIDEIDDDFDQTFEAIMQKIKDNINTLILKNNLSMQEIADAIDSDVSYVYGLCRKNKRPGLKKIIQLTKVFKCSLNEIIPDMELTKLQQKNYSKFIDLTKNCGEKEMECIFEIINAYNNYSIQKGVLGQVDTPPALAVGEVD